MRQVQNGALNTQLKRWSWLTACLALALLSSGCLEDGAGTGPSSGAARLALNANVAGSSASASAVTALGVAVSYVRSEGEPALLLDKTIPLTGVSPGGTVRQPVSVDLAPCLADPFHQPGGSTCSVLVRVTLLAGDFALDVVQIGPLSLRPGETSDPAEVTLHTANKLLVTPASSAALFPGETVQMTASLIDAAGSSVEGRAIAWSSNAPSVATVDVSGKVTAVAPGNVLISAAGGDLTTTVPMRVVARPKIVLDRQSIIFAARRSGPQPVGQNARIVNGVAGTLDGLAVGMIDYRTGPSGWLSAALSGSSAPATLVLRPTSTDLAPGSYSATVPITAPTAGNSGIAVQVTYNVSAATVLKVDQSLIQAAGRFYPTSGKFQTSVTSEGPVAGLRADVDYGPHASGWLTAKLSSDSTPAELLLAISSFQLPGNYQADVRVSAPGASNDVTVQVLWTVPKTGWFFNLYPSPECVFVPDPLSADSVYIGATLSERGSGTLQGQSFFVRAIDPGLTMVSDSGTTYGSPAIAVRTRGSLGEIRVVATVGTRESAPGSLADTTTILFQNYDRSACYQGGSRSRAPYVPGVPALRRAPVVRPPTTGTGQATVPRARKPTRASAPPPVINRSRPTPEPN